MQLYSQNSDTLFGDYKGMLSSLKAGDSLIYYQCHVEDATMRLSTSSGQTISSSPQKFSITEKFVVVRGENSYTIRHYTSAITELPNRKFSGLKIRERPYWNFKKETEAVLTPLQLKLMNAFEKKGKEAIEYDFAISKNNTNQVIIKHRKSFKQLVIEGNYRLSGMFSK